MNIIKKLIKEKDEFITFNHQKKDLSTLKTTLSQLIEESHLAKKDLDSVLYLLDLVEKHNINELTNLSDEVIKHEHFNKWLEKTKTIFEKFHLKNTDKLESSDKDFIASEKTKLVNEKERLKRQVNYLDAIVAKTKFLIKDLENTFCTDLTDGFKINAVEGRLLEKFGAKTNPTYTYESGRREIIKFLEETYSINTIQSKNLFNLLEDKKSFKFEIDNSTLNFSEYYNDDIKGGSNWVPLFGSWIFNK